MSKIWAFFIDLWNWNEPTADSGCGFDPWGCPKGE